MGTLVVREWHVGQDAYGRTVMLREERNYDGKVLWGIKSLPSSQRDEGEIIRGLSLDSLHQIAGIVAGLKP